MTDVAYSVDQRIRLLVDVWEEGEYLPHNCLAQRGETLIVRRTGGKFTFPLFVSHPNVTDRSFGVYYSEVELLEDACKT